jgi:hypothetical protein
MQQLMIANALLGEVNEGSSPLDATISPAGLKVMPAVRYVRSAL